MAQISRKDTGGLLDRGGRPLSAYGFPPQRWFDPMNMVENYEGDQSVEDRLWIWQRRWDENADRARDLFRSYRRPASKHE